MMDLDLICRVLAGQNLAQWQVRETQNIRHERYVTFLHRDCEREVRQTRYDVWFALAPNEGRQGEAEFCLSGGDTPDVLRQRLLSAMASAPQALMPAFSLPGPQDPGVAHNESGVSVASDGTARLVRRSEQSADVDIVLRAPSALDSMENQWAESLAAVPWTRPSHGELFATAQTVRLRNHRGLDVSEQRTRAYGEFVLLHKPAQGDEVEIMDRVEAASLPGLDLLTRTQEAALEVRALATAQAPTPGRHVIALRGEHLAELLGWYVGHADASQHARGIAALKIGEPVLTGGQLPDLTVDARVPSLASYRFDQHGYAACQQSFVKQNVLTSLHGDGRWMQVLGQSPRGTAGTLCVNPGAVPAQELLRDCLEIVRFSEFHARHDTGAFSGEIRFAWLHRRGQAPQAVRGGSVTGVVHEALKNLQLSHERLTTGRWCGPALGLIDATVAI